MMIEIVWSWYSKSRFSLRMNLSSTWDELVSGAARVRVIPGDALYEFAYQRQHHQYLFKCLLCVGISLVVGVHQNTKQTKIPRLLDTSLEEAEKQ